MSKVLNKIVDVEGQLPRSEQGIPNFPGKGLLTALVDTSGSEIKRQRDLEDSLKQSMVAPLISKYWTGNLNDDERQAVADQIRATLGGGKRTKAFLDKMFEVGGQIHGVNKMLTPPPGAAQQAAQTAVQESKADQGQAGAETDVAEATSMLPPPPTAGVLAPPPTAAGVTAEAQQPNVASGVAPLQSALTKMYPPALGEEEKLKIQHKNKMEEDAQTNAARMAELQAQIDAGRFDKNSRLAWKIEMVDGKAKNVLYVLGPDGTEIKREVKGDAPANWANRLKDGWILQNGRPVAVKLDPLTNQIVEGSENSNLIPPASLLPKLSQTEVAMVNPETGETMFVPKKTIRGVDISGLEATTPADAGGSAAAGQPSEEVINFLMTRNPGQSREQVIAAASSPLTPPPTGGTTSPPPTLPGGPGGGAGGAGQTGVPPVTPAGPGPLAPPPLQPRSTGMLTPGTYNQSVQREIPVREAYSQIVGTSDFPNAPSLMNYATIADDPARRKKLANALTATFDGMEVPEKARGSIMNLIEYWAGIPAATISAKVSTMADIIGKELENDPELQRAYNAEMAMIGTATGLRALTKAGVAEANVRRAINELPLIGINSFNSRDMYDKMRRVMMEVYTGAKKTPTMAAQEKSFIENKVNELERLAAGTGIRQPPGAASTGATGGTGGDAIIRVRIKSGPNAGRTARVPKKDFNAQLMEIIPQ